MPTLRQIRRAEGVPEHMLDLLPHAFEECHAAEDDPVLEFDELEGFQIEHYFPRVLPCL